MSRFHYAGDTEVLKRHLDAAGLSHSFVTELQRLMPYRRLTSFLSQIGVHQDDPAKVAAVLAESETQLAAVKAGAAALDELLAAARSSLQPTAPAKARAK